MNILLTGGTGFIGSHLLRLLGDTDHHVTALRRVASQPCIALTMEPVWSSASMDALGAADFEGMDAFVHLASVGVSPKTASWQDLLHWNVTVTLGLLEKAHAAGVKKFVLAGSFAEYGLSADRFDAIPVDAPLLPVSPYAASKAAGFMAAHAFAIEKNVELHYLRIFSAYGEGQYAGNFWPALRAAALSGQDFPMTPGEQVRDFVPVEDVAQAFLKAIDSPVQASSPPPHVANVGSGHAVSMLAFAQACWVGWGATGRILAGARPYRPNEPMRFVPQL